MSRRPLDAYYTPDTLAEKLVGLLPVRRGAAVVEPSVGGGAFARALRLQGAGVVGCDIDPQAAGFVDCVRHQVGDFLTTPLDVEPDWVIGNPPFRGFEAHLDRALQMAPEVAFLLRLAVMESAGRVARWVSWPLARVWVLAERPSFTGGGTDSAAYGWFWFSRSHTGHPTVTPGWSWK